MNAQSRESWEQQVARDPASVLRLIASGEYVPFSIRRQLERRGLFDLNRNTYGITAAGTALLDLDDARASKETAARRSGDGEGGAMSVSVIYEVVCTYEVEAESEDAARRVADGVAQNLARTGVLRSSGTAGTATLLRTGTRDPATERAELEVLRDLRARVIGFGGDDYTLMSWTDAHRRHGSEPYIGCPFCRDRFVRRDAIDEPLFDAETLLEAARTDPEEFRRRYAQVASIWRRYAGERDA